MSGRPESFLGEVYFLRARRFVKIGWSMKFSQRRIQLQSGNPHKLELMHKFEGKQDDESLLHIYCKRLHHRGEWFKYDSVFFHHLLTGLKDNLSVREAGDRVEKIMEKLSAQKQ